MASIFRPSVSGGASVFRQAYPTRWDDIPGLWDEIEGSFDHPGPPPRIFVAAPARGSSLFRPNFIDTVVSIDDLTDFDRLEE